jgi:hypothetical protein
MCSDSFAKEHHSTGSINSIGRMQRVLFGHVEVQFFYVHQIHVGNFEMK